MVRAVSLHVAIVLASLIAASVTLVACGPGASHAQGAPGAGGPPPAAVVVMSLAAANLAMNYEYVGQTAGSRDVEVRARVAGTRDAVGLHAGVPSTQGSAGPPG
jgi:membrane fusion protein (multidrug efflux system)